MNRLLSAVFDAPSAARYAASARRWSPALDLVEADDHYVLHADLPGLTESDVTLEVDGDVLTLSGERKIEREVRKGGAYHVERASGTFVRSLTLPEGVDASAIEASFADGVLEVRIPKPAQRKPQRVEIAVGGSRPAIEAEAAEAAQNN